MVPSPDGGLVVIDALSGDAEVDEARVVTQQDPGCRARRDHAPHDDTRVTGHSDDHRQLF